MTPLQYISIVFQTHMLYSGAFEVLSSLLKE